MTKQEREASPSPAPQCLEGWPSEEAFDDMLAALKACVRVFNQLADAGNYPLPLLNNGGWHFAVKAIAKAEAVLSLLPPVGPAPIPVRGRFFYTRCEHCGWHGSSEQCGTINYGDDADVTCPACKKIFLADEALPPVGVGGSDAETCKPQSHARLEPMAQSNQREER